MMVVAGDVTPVPVPVPAAVVPEMPALATARSTGRPSSAPSIQAARGPRAVTSSDAVATSAPAARQAAATASRRAASRAVRLSRTPGAA